ncbi:hypothetical protein AAC387_Pa08g1550 [Persea americana]
MNLHVQALTLLFVYKLSISITSNLASPTRPGCRIGSALFAHLRSVLFHAPLKVFNSNPNITRDTSSAKLPVPVLAFIISISVFLMLSATVSIYMP